MLKKIGRVATALMALGLMQGAQIGSAAAQPPGYNSCFSYALWLCNYYGEDIGLPDEPQCLNTVKASCENGYYYEDIIYAGLVLRLKQEHA
jgi:hypothetical protein